MEPEGSSDTYGLHRCPNCGGLYEGAEFYHLRTLGVVCASCVLSATGHETIEDYQRESFERGARSPREG